MTQDKEDSASRASAEACHIIDALADAFGLREDDDVIRALKYFGQEQWRRPCFSILPWELRREDSAYPKSSRNLRQIETSWDEVSEYEFWHRTAKEAAKKYRRYWQGWLDIPVSHMPETTHREVLTLLENLGDDPNPDDVDRITGSRGWTSMQCSYCNKYHNKLVAFGSFGNELAMSCKECLLAATRAFEKEP